VIESASFREAGTGPGVVCLHCSASNSGQWRALMESAASRFHVLAPDLYGCGRSPRWPESRPMWLDDQVELLESVFERAGGRFHLVGHSYGGAIALVAALRFARKVKSLVLYEPVLFAVLLRAEPQSDAASEIIAVRDAVTSQPPAVAAERFIDYWMGAGTWASTPEPRRAGLIAAVQAQRPEWHSAFCEPTPLEAFRALELPTLLLSGERSTAAARAVARLLRSVLPQVEFEEIAHAGHMAPLTAPHLVNPLIERFLSRTSQGEAA